MENAVLQLDPKDNVLVALQDLRQGERINFADQTYILATDVHAKHKFATQDIAAGRDLIMYGVLVGKARQFAVFSVVSTVAENSGKPFTTPHNSK